MIFSHIRRTYITVMRRCHSFHSLISRRHSQTHFQRRCLGHTSFSIHGDRRIYSVPRFRPGIDPFIGHSSRTGMMPVYRAPCIYSLIHRDITTSMARGLSAKPPVLFWHSQEKDFVKVPVQRKESLSFSFILRCTMCRNKF